VLQGADPLHYARTAGALKPEVLRPLLAPDLPCFKVLYTTHIGFRIRKNPNSSKT
jgi:hypothetical protein